MFRSIGSIGLRLPVAIVLLLALVMGAYAQEDAEATLDPAIGDIASQFYDWYIDTLQASNFNIDGAYRDSPYLTEELIANMDSFFATDDLANNYDPFLCVQALPQSYALQITDYTEDTATVLMRQDFGSPLTNNIMISLVYDDGNWKIDDIICGDTVTPTGIVQTFVDSWLAYSQPDPETETMNNPMVDRIWRDSDLLTEDLIARLDAMMDSDRPIGHDPVLCAQDVPRYAEAFEIDIRDGRARVLINEFFGDFRVPHRVVAELTETDDGWRIDDFVCLVEPETIALAFYRIYSDYTRYDIANGIERTRLIDWGFNWSAFLGEDLLAELVSLVTSETQLPADPVLCAQDIPAYVEVEVIERTGDELNAFLTATLRGFYPSGPEDITGYDLATLQMETFMGRWAITDITCGAEN